MPHGLARFCSGPAWAEAALSASLYMAATSRYHFTTIKWHCMMLQDLQPVMVLAAW